MKCSVTGVLVLLEIKRGYEFVKKERYNQDIGSTGACKNRTTEEAVWLGQIRGNVLQIFFPFFTVGLNQKCQLML